MHRSKSCSPRKITSQQKYQNNNVSIQYSPTRTHAALFQASENETNNPFGNIMAPDTEYDFFENDLDGNRAPPNSPATTPRTPRTPRCKA